MWDLISSAVLGAGTGVVGLVFGGITKAFTWWAQEKEKASEHQRVLELTKLQHDLRSQELELEREIALENAAAQLRQASYTHDSQTGQASQWVIDVLRLVRPALTGGLIALLWCIYLTIANAGDKASIVASVIYMATSSVTWWFGDRVTTGKTK